MVLSLTGFRQVRPLHEPVFPGSSRHESILVGFAGGGGGGNRLGDEPEVDTDAAGGGVDQHVAGAHGAQYAGAVVRHAGHPGGHRLRGLDRARGGRHYPAGGGVFPGSAGYRAVGLSGSDHRRRGGVEAFHAGRLTAPRRRAFYNLFPRSDDGLGTLQRYWME